MDERKGYVDSIDAVLEGTKQMRELYQNEFGEIAVVRREYYKRSECFELYRIQMCDRRYTLYRFN